MFRVIDPRRGQDYEFRFSRKEVRKASEFRRIVLISEDPKYKGRDTVAELVESLWEYFGSQQLFLHVTPAPYRRDQAEIYPTTWTRLFCTRLAWMFKVPQFEQHQFDEYFLRTSSYEAWMFYFSRRHYEIDALDPFEEFGFSPQMFTSPPVPWDATLFYEGEFSYRICLLPCDSSSDEFIKEMVRTKKASWLD